ncbi:hypothetical protein [Nonomuraea fuscirosea]|uniref:hypothetical protein n=1 Tax=Nonomuraea fuscirosea TaxID=1291556 RepID=UPI0033D95320
MELVWGLSLVVGGVVALAALGIAAYAIRKLSAGAPGRLVAVLGAITTLVVAIPALFQTLLGAWR